MKPEELKKILGKFKKIQGEVASLRRAITRLRAQVETVHSTASDGLPRSGKTIDIVADAVCRLDNAIERYRNKIIALINELMECEYLISLCSDQDGRTILREHYINGIDFDEIPRLIYKSERAMWRCYKNAIKEICEKSWQ